MRSGRTWCPIMEKVATRFIPSQKARDWRKYEDRFKNEFKGLRCSGGGTEVFNMTPRDARRAESYLKRMRFR